MNERLYSFLMRCIIASMFLGILGMIQPWHLPFFKRGFQLLLFSTLAYIILSHITPRTQEPSSGDRP